MSLLKAYFNREQLEVDWSVLEGLAPHVLHNLLIGQLPFGVAERQTLIDTVAADDRARLLAGLIDQAISGGLGQTAKPH
jgi:Lon protease-like protein